MLMAGKDNKSKLRESAMILSQILSLWEFPVREFSLPGPSQAQPSPKKS